MPITTKTVANDIVEVTFRAILTTIETSPLLLTQLEYTEHPLRHRVQIIMVLVKVIVIGYRFWCRNGNYCSSFNIVLEELIYYSVRSKFIHLCYP